MKHIMTKRLAQSIYAAEEKLAQLTLKERAYLEKEWDIEHAYYSSALAGSGLDRKEFERIGETIA